MFNVGESTVRLILFWGGLFVFLVLELSIPYRTTTVSKLKRWVNNLAITLLNSALIYLIFSSIIFSTVAYVQSNKAGVLNLVQAPTWLKILAMLVFLDFMLYVWHLLNHEVPFLWRFHRVHHSDLNMDVSTATRFHIGELAISAIIKTSLIFFLGASALGVLIFESAVVLNVQFHHSSLKVPKWIEAIYWILLVPPSMHRIHHSVVINERNTNYGALFSLWDRIFGTLLTRVEQERIKIGMGAYQKPGRLNFHQLLWMPFTKAAQ